MCNKKLTPHELAAYTDGIVYGQTHEFSCIENILFDSRRLNQVKGTAFFALKTDKNDGIKYINDLYNKGIRIFITHTPPSDKAYGDATFVVVDNVLEALQTLAKEYRKRMNGTIVAVTGSNGKTITKDWIIRLIGGKLKTCSNPKSFNSQIGVAYSVYQMQQDDGLGVFEAGISRPGEMEKLADILQPDIGIFTNIGDAHQANFESLEQKTEEKLKLFASCKKMIYHDNNSMLTRKIKTFAKEHNIEVIAWGDYPWDTVLHSEIEKQLTLPFDDPASTENAINAYLLCLEAGIDKKHLQSAVRQLEQLESRFEILSGINNSIIVNDSYSCDLVSLEIALDYLNGQNKVSKTVILSDLQQSTTDKHKLYEDINRLIVNKKINRLIAVGPDFYTYQDLITVENKQFYLSVEEFLLNLHRKDFINKAVLIKGASSMHFERITQALAAKGHQSVLEINLSALEDNVKYFRSKLKPDTMVMAMVKASSYGCGGYQVAYCLEKDNLADYFTVAFADEGVELRQKGIQKPIMVMTPENNTDKFLQYNLEPVVHSQSVLDRFINEKIKVHIKLDTGMHRLGFEAKDLTDLVHTLKNHKNIHIASVFSHLYGADDTALDAYTYQQIDLYEQMSGFILNHFDYKILRHLCNSAASVRFPQAHYDMVRLGIGMYGIGVNTAEQRQLRFVHKLRSTITQTREIKAGEDVSYSRRFVSANAMRIGVIPIGYADGLNRHLGCGNIQVYVNGKLCPIIGNICMDMCMIDITQTNAKEGDTVVIFGNENPVFRLSEALNTIPYEIFTSVSQRIKRVYYQE
ncbi:MAG: bifunctional UDP-N-acetylmuramoyl-tripeptide:D-alanyl-D-alanine ligase/alanine racemase [Bacteroidales bacterium]|nr:bifunctional UDP-N-acetylmuramoyl-tripeptide:D-alanyl-D-alanine ligase/alanine racemase [Bacteroidales bacterium]